MPNDWNEVRYTLDKSENFAEICNSPWYSDAIYDKFSDAEYERRHNAARELMARDGLDAIILTGSPNIYSLGSGITWGSGLIDERGMAQYMILPKVGEPTVIYPHPGCHIEAARRMVSIRDVRGGQRGKFGKAIADRLEELGLQEGRIGVTASDRTGPEFMGVNAYLELQQRLPKLTILLLPKLLHELTYRKSNEEIEAMAIAGKLAIASLEAVAKVAKPGIREYQLEAAATHAVLEGGGRTHLMMIGSTSMHDPRLVFPNPRPSHRVLKEGDIILAELAAAYKGYSAKIGHPITIGKPTAEFDEFFKKLVVPGFKAIQSRLIPGTPLEEVRKAGAHFRQAGGQSRPILMHGLDLITAQPYISVDHVGAEPYETHVTPGMTFSIEITPINAAGTFGMFFCRSYAITETGPMDLTPYPVDELIVASA
jgi:Xaa-Pro aminopeptidase